MIVQLPVIMRLRQQVVEAEVQAGLQVVCGAGGEQDGYTALDSGDHSRGRLLGKGLTRGHDTSVALAAR